MSVDLSKVVLATSANSFKNDDQIYTGSINFPTSLLASQLSVTTVTVNLSEVPNFSKFYAYFKEYLDATVGGAAQWYPANVGGQWSVGIYVSAPSGYAGWINCAIYPVIEAGVIYVTAAVFNPYSVNITLTALNVPFAFVIYSLAN
jgi:hypothetical protein